MGANGLARRLWHGPGDAYGPTSNLQTVPSAPPAGRSWPRRRDRFHNRSCSSTPSHAFPHIRPRVAAQPGSPKWDTAPCWIFKKQKPKLPVVVFISVGVCTITHEALSSQPSARCLNSILGKSNLQFAGMTISLTISTSSLNLLASDCKQVRMKPARLF